MMTPSNGEHALDLQAGNAALRPVRPFYWSVRRELWEYRSIYIAPLAAGALGVAGFMINIAARLPAVLRGLPMIDAMHQRDELMLPYETTAGLIMAAAMIVGIFYSLDALYGERRDRSILFWKSMPVSDLTTVLAKATVPLAILPLLAFAITLAAQITLLFFSTTIATAHHLSAAPIWAQVGAFQLPLTLLYHLLTVHVLWHAPFYGWMLLVSAWARRVPVLWAALPPLGIVAVERILFNTAHFGVLLHHRFAGGPEAMTPTMSNSFPIDPMMQLTPLRFLASPGLWIGLAVTAGLLYTASRVRRHRGPI